MRYNQTVIELFSFFWTLVATSIGVVGLGLVAGFSPILYGTQAGLSIHPRNTTRMMIIIIAGVLTGTLLLGFFFSFFQITTLTAILNSTIQAIIVNTAFQIIVGAVLFIIGIRFLRRPKATTQKKQPTQQKPATEWTLFSFAVAKTILSASGAAAVFIATGIIIDSSLPFLTQIISAVVFLAATILPFVFILWVWVKSPHRFQTVADSVKAKANKIHYRKIFGWAFLGIGISLIALNVTSYAFTFLTFLVG